LFILLVNEAVRIALQSGRGVDEGPGAQGEKR